MILFLFGPDTFRSREYLANSVEQFKKQRDPGGYNVKRLDGKTAEASLLIAELRSAPFLAEKRLVVVENILSNNNKETLASIQEKIEQKQIPESTVAIFWQGEAMSKVKEAKELEAVLKKEKFAQEFAPLVGPQLTAWIQKKAAEYGTKIEPGAAEALAGNIGSDMWHLASTVHQLAAYAGSRTITLADAQLFLEEKIDDNVFNLVDAVAGGNHKQALKLLDGQRKLGEEDGKLFGLFLWQFRIMLSIGDLLARDPSASSDTAAKLLGVHPFVAKKNFAIARKHSLAKLTALYNHLLDIDIKTKTGQAKQELLLDIFVASV